mmetsp:Transcript_53841/g.60157  ORF Transcript_53841/g.60157 Transcript_53841/m.60157 type:complete len:254 (+) Transcript_53841:280-1041(+)
MVVTGCIFPLSAWWKHPECGSHVVSDKFSCRPYTTTCPTTCCVHVQVGSVIFTFFDSVLFLLWEDNKEHISIRVVVNDRDNCSFLRWNFWRCSFWRCNFLRFLRPRPLHFGRRFFRGFFLDVTVTNKVLAENMKDGINIGSLLRRALQKQVDSVFSGKCMAFIIADFPLVTLNIALVPYQNHFLIFRMILLNPFQMSTLECFKTFFISNIVHKDKCGCSFQRCSCYLVKFGLPTCVPQPNTKFSTADFEFLMF